MESGAALIWESVPRDRFHVLHRCRSASLAVQCGPVPGELPEPGRF